MTEEIKPIELEDEALNQVAGGNIAVLPTYLYRCNSCGAEFSSNYHAVDYCNVCGQRTAERIGKVYPDLGL